jgi:hypothetical protein
MAEYLPDALVLEVSLDADPPSIPRTTTQQFALHQSLPKIALSGCSVMPWRRRELIPIVHFEDLGIEDS